LRAGRIAVRPSKKPVATGIREGTRVCPNCGTQEVRWVVANVDYVNLSPLTNQCVSCLVGSVKESGPWRETPEAPRW